MAQKNDTDEAWFNVIDPADPSDEEREKCGTRLHAMIGRLENDQAGRMEMLVKYASMYQNMDVLQGSGAGQTMPQMILNVTQAIVDSLVAKQVVNESKATFDVDEGDWEAHLMAEDMDRFCFGEMYRLDGYPKHEQTFRDCAWSGDGWLKYSAVNRKVYSEKTSPFEMLLDEAACASAEPRELYQRRYISKSAAQRAYPEFAAQIAAMQPQSPPVPIPGATEGGMIKIVEAWHLPESENGKVGDQIETDPETGEEVNTGRMGVWCVAINDLVVELDEYKCTRFPFVRMQYSNNVRGGYSIGLVQQLAPMQVELNKLKHRKLQGLKLYGIPRQFRQSGSTCTPDFNTDIGQEYVWTGSKPEVVESPCFSPELGNEEQNLINQMYQLAGISPLERGSDMPSRMDSRPGMREYIAAADEKHALPSQTWNRSFLDSARCIIDQARYIVEEHGSYEAFGAAKDFVSKIDFKDINLEDERFRIKLQNTNLLPTTPTGKRLAILDLLKANAFTNPMEMWEMLAGDHPDVDGFLDRKTSGRKLVEKQMYVITVKRKYFGPDIHQDVLYAKSVALDNVQKILLRSNGGYKDDEGTPNAEAQKIVSMLDKYILACDDIDKRAKKAEQDAAAGAAAVAGAITPPGLPGTPTGPNPVPQPPGPVPGPVGPAPIG